MKGKSNSFRQVTPFYPRHGIPLYRAFPLDITNPTQAQPSGCMSVTPRVDFVADGQVGGPFSVEEMVYTISNNGGATLDWALEITEDWLVANVTSGTLAAGETAFVTVTLQADELPFSFYPYSASLVFTNITNDCGSVTLSSAITVNQEFLLIGSFAPSYRSKAGEASLCGFSEYLTPFPSPPKKWRRLSSSGIVHICYEADLVTCRATDPDLRFIDSFNVDAATDSSYDQLTCAFTQGHYGHRVTAGPPCVYTTPSPPTVVDVGQLSPGSANQLTANSVITRTHKTYSETFDPSACILSSPFFARTYGTTGQILSEEDTELDAITRFDLGNAFGAWGPDVEIAKYEHRVSGYSFEYGAAQFRVQASGITPGASVKVNVELIRGPFPGGPMVSIGVQSFMTTANGLGEIDFIQDIPNVAGFETSATGNALVYEGLL